MTKFQYLPAGAFSTQVTQSNRILHKNSLAWSLYFFTGLLILHWFIIFKQMVYILP